MRRVLLAAACILSLVAGCQTVHYDGAKGHFDVDPETYQPPSQR